MEASSIIGILLMMILSGFFSGMEIGFVASNRMLAEMDREKNGIAQRCLAIFYRNPNGFVSTMLVGNNIVLVIYGILFADIFDKTLFASFEPASRVVLDTVCSTIVILFTGEFLPKTFFKANPNKLLTFFAPLAFVFFILLWPISKFATGCSRVFLRLLGVKMGKEETNETFSKVDLDYLVQSSIDNAENEEDIEDEVKIFQNALEFPDTKVRDCMVPRTEINAVEQSCTLAELQQKFIESGNSKILVYEEDIDHIKGYIHSSELFKSSDNWKDNIRTMPFVPETMPAQKLMKIFLQQKRSLGVVVDEFGGTSGIVSLEDIVEEIFGEIEDEHDKDNYIAKDLGNGEYLLSARLEIDNVNEKFDLHLPESDEYMTIGGLLLHTYQSFPQINETVKVGQYEFKIIKKTMTKLELVRLRTPAKE